MKMILTLSILVSCLLPPFALAWDNPGHEIVALYAEQELNTDAKAAIENLLLPGETLASISTWADQVRYAPNAYSYTYGFHFADTTTLDNNYYTVPVDPSGDVVQALAHYEDTLRSTKASSLKTDALKFFIHFVGDIHQPLHAAIHADLSGNSVPVRWYGQSSFISSGKSHGMELHEIWDGQMIDHFRSLLGWAKSGSSDADWENKYVAYLKQEFSKQFSEEQNFETTTYIDWAVESHTFNQQAYDVGDGRYLNQAPLIKQNVNLGDDYYNRNIRIVNLRLAQAGHRLAYKLNQIFSDEPISAQEQGMRDFLKIACDGKCKIDENLEP